VTLFREVEAVMQRFVSKILLLLFDVGCEFRILKSYLPIRGEVRKIGTAVTRGGNSDVRKERLNNNSKVISVVVLGLIADGVKTKAHVLSSIAGCGDLSVVTNSALAQPGV